MLPYGVIFGGCGTPKPPTRGFNPLGIPNIRVTMVQVGLCLGVKEGIDGGVVLDLALRKKGLKEY
jgi:hypothetical protein